MVTPFVPVRHPVVSRSRPHPSRFGHRAWSRPRRFDRPGRGKRKLDASLGAALIRVSGLGRSEVRLNSRGACQSGEPGRAQSRWRNHGLVCLISPAGAGDHGDRRCGQIAVNERASRWSPAATRGDGRLGELANARCTLCGIELSIISLVPDGGPGSTEVRWYCRDIISCTERWTADRARPAAQAPVPDPNPPDPDAEAVPGDQAVPGGDTAPVPSDAAEPAGVLTTAEPAPAEKPARAEEPRRGKARAAQSSQRGRQHAD
jgi:hypothetical protein